MAIYFIWNETHVKIPDRKKLKNYIQEIFKREGRVLKNLNYIFCTDQYLLTINTQFLDHDDYTDIITFCLSGPSEPIEGEIYISVDRVIENAERFGISINEELHRVIFHGALHLCGYNDKTPIDKRKMTNLENMNLQSYFS